MPSSPRRQCTSGSTSSPTPSARQDWNKKRTLNRQGVASLTHSPSPLATTEQIRDWVKIRASSRHPAEQLQKTLAKFDESDLYVGYHSAFPFPLPEPPFPLPWSRGVITWYEFERGMREVGVTVKQGDLVALRSALDSRQGGELAHKPFSHIADDRKTIDIHSIRKAQASSDAARNIARHIRGHDTPSEGYKELWLTRHKGSADVDESEVARADRLLASRSNEPRHTLLGNANTVAESMRKRDSEREHAASLLRQLVADNREQAHEAFAKFDEHGDGFVSWKVTCASSSFRLLVRCSWGSSAYVRFSDRSSSRRSRSRASPFPRPIYTPSLGSLTLVQLALSKSKSCWISSPSR